MLKDFEFTIPSLVRADLIVKGIEWLDANGKRFSKDEPQERVNVRWSKVLSERVKDKWNIFEGMTYHKIRDAYFAACVRNAEIEGSVKSVDYERYASKFLEITILKPLDDIRDLISSLVCSPKYNLFCHSTSFLLIKISL
jgi:hypothetical protein